MCYTRSKPLTLQGASKFKMKVFNVTPFKSLLLLFLEMKESKNLPKKITEEPKLVISISLNFCNSQLTINSNFN